MGKNGMAYDRLQKHRRNLVRKGKASHWMRYYTLEECKNIIAEVQNACIPNN